MKLKIVYSAVEERKVLTHKNHELHNQVLAETASENISPNNNHKEQQVSDFPCLHFRPHSQSMRCAFSHQLNVFRTQPFFREQHIANSA